MRIKSIKVENFKCLGEENNINWDDIIVLVGENNTGKSSVLQALNIFFSSDKTIELKLFKNFEKTEKGESIDPIKITVAFTDLTDEDKKQRGVHNRLNCDGDWILLKVFNYSVSQKSDPVKYYTLTQKREIAGLNQTATWDEVLEKFPESEVALGKKGTNKMSPDEFLELINEAVKKWPGEVGSDTKDEWLLNPGGIQTNIDALFLHNFELIFVKAVHKVEEESSGIKSSFVQLFNILIGDAISNSKAMEAFKKSLRGVLSLYGKDKVGNHLIPEIGKLEKELSEKLERMIEAKTIIEPNAIGEDKVLYQTLPIPSLFIYDGYKTQVEDQGHGLQRCLILALLETLAEHKTKNLENIGPKNILMIEEPELYMHPQMERKMQNALYDIAEKKNFQVICTTHSPVFLNMADKHRSIICFEKGEENKVKIKQVTEEIFTGTALADQKARLRMLLSFDPMVNELFFARRIVLVEGDSEIAAFQKAAELLEIDAHIIKNTTFINCRGKKTIPAFIQVLNHFDKKFKVVHDKDEEDSFNTTIDQLSKERGLGQVSVIENNLEDLLGISSKAKDKPIRAMLRVEELHQKKELDKKLKKYIKFIFEI